MTVYGWGGPPQNHGEHVRKLADLITFRRLPCLLVLGKTAMCVYISACVCADLSNALLLCCYAAVLLLLCCYATAAAAVLLLLLLCYCCCCADVLLM